ncbi:hypothetical protein [Methanobrevibacter sp.]|uniref:hypothetical protein n=1 Tax=Methanobrevibacter sp. TaxID=66852 RepID=UPI003890C3ED
MEFTITSEQILWICGFICAIWGTYKIYKEVKKPNEDKAKMLLEHERKLQNDDERLKEIEATDKLILQSLLVLIQHDITGNGIDHLKKARDEIQEYLINR